MKLVASVLVLVWLSSFFVWAPLILAKPDVNVWIADHTWPTRKLTVCASGDTSLADAVKWAVSEWDRELGYFAFRLFIPQIALLGFREASSGEPCEIYVKYHSGSPSRTADSTQVLVASISVKPRESMLGRIVPESAQVSLHPSLSDQPEKLRIIVLHYFGHILGIAHIRIGGPMKTYPLLTAAFHGQAEIPSSSRISSLEAYALHKKYFSDSPGSHLAGEKMLSLPETMPFIVYGDPTTDVRLAALSTFITALAFLAYDLFRKMPGPRRAMAGVTLKSKASD